MVHILLAFVVALFSVVGLALFRRIRELEDLVALQAMDRRRLEESWRTLFYGLELDAGEKLRRIVESINRLDADFVGAVEMLTLHKEGIQAINLNCRNCWLPPRSYPDRSRGYLKPTMSWKGRWRNSIYLPGTGGNF